MGHIPSLKTMIEGWWV